MQEIVLFLTGVAGAASAVAYRRLPRGGRRAGRQEGGDAAAGGPDAAGRIRSRIGMLEAERDILGKAISRVHGDAGLDGRQRDALLALYQRQLSAVLAKIDRLEEAGRHPDLGAVGDGLAALMDQKLSSLDERLHELSARIAAAVPAAAVGAEAGAEAAAARKHGRKGQGKRAAAEAAAVREEAAAGGGGSGAVQQASLDAAQAQQQQAAAQQETLDAAQAQAQAQAQQQQAAQKAAAAEVASGPPARPAPPGGGHAVKPVEITTLTTIGGGERRFPAVGRPKGPAAGAQPPAPAPAPAAAAGAGAGRSAEPVAKAAAPAGAAVAVSAAAAAAATGPGPHRTASQSLPDKLPRPSAGMDLAEEEAGAADGAAGGRAADDDLEAIVAEIRSTLSKLEQAEVE